MFSPDKWEVVLEQRYTSSALNVIMVCCMRQHAATSWYVEGGESVETRIKGGIKEGEGNVEEETRAVWFKQDENVIRASFQTRLAQSIRSSGKETSTQARPRQEQSRPGLVSSQVKTAAVGARSSSSDPGERGPPTTSYLPATGSSGPQTSSSAKRSVRPAPCFFSFLFRIK
ncbi:hypothetical protein Q5P01_007011 [Channa striata]|uniref:Uncharacterized protein n=1 Tax=Channa striata TaxID=64152 RepID=A0AA88N9Z0_CHASR|nr:hypothetical protein Q5P01_007011 [Channa striata]